MIQHWAQIASKANIRWLRQAIQQQENNTLSLRKLTSYALTKRGISSNKLLVYMNDLKSYYK